MIQGVLTMPMIHSYLPFILITFMPFICCCCCYYHHCHCVDIPVIMSKPSNLDQIHKSERDRFESWKESNIEVRQLREQLKTILNDHPQHPLLYSRLPLLLSKKKQYMDFQMPPSLFREKKHSFPMPIPTPDSDEYNIPIPKPD